MFRHFDVRFSIFPFLFHIFSLRCHVPWMVRFSVTSTLAFRCVDYALLRFLKFPYIDFLSLIFSDFCFRHFDLFVILIFVFSVTSMFGFTVAWISPFPATSIFFFQFFRICRCFDFRCLTVRCSIPDFSLLRCSIRDSLFTSICRCFVFPLL